jgi:hypothetical protein
MNAIKEQARYAGLLYLLLAIVGFIVLIVIPSQFIVSGDATATADRIAAHGLLWRIGIALELIVSVMFIFLAVALYQLFKTVNESYALLMMILALVSVPIAFLSSSFEIIAQSIYGGPSFLSSLDKAQLDSLGYIFLRMHAEGVGVESIFWGLWLFPFGLLVMRSGFIPRLLGVLLLIAGFGYVIGFFGPLLLPQYSSLMDQVTMILILGELPIIVWLFIWGARAKPTEAPTS